jgi:dienelactone hydrolase
MFTEWIVETATGPLTCSLITPPAERMAVAPALLLTFATTRQAALGEPPQDIAARLLAEAGCYVVSFDLPNHGERINGYGAGIEGLCASYLAGADPFAQFVTDGSAVIDACLQRGLGAPGRIVACGVSRAGYCVLRLAAADVRIVGVAALAPVIDWRALSEFAAVRQEPMVAALALEHWATQLAGRALFLAIGNQDRRVGSHHTLRFVQQLYAAQQLLPQEGAAWQLHVVDSPGHSLADEWRVAGAHYLLDSLPF